MKRTMTKLLGIALLLTASACSQSASGSTDLDSSQPYTPPPPQSPEVLAPYVGRWEGQSLTVVLHKDGRAAILNRASSSVPAEVGTYRIVSPKSIEFDWLFSGHEQTYATVSGDALTLSIYDLSRTAQASEAQNAYDAIYQPLVTESGTYRSRFLVGAASGAHDPLDPHPERRNAGATVYSGEGLYLYDSFSTSAWEELPNGRINVYDGYSRADMWLLPDGRVCNQIWLWQGVDVHDEAHVKHVLSWGKYSVTPGQNPLEGDVVHVAFDNGSSAAYRMVGGRRYLKTREITYHNAALKQR
jgi:hypothetical protein